MISILVAFLLWLAAPGGQGEKPAQPKSGFRAEFMGNIAGVEQKILDLARAMPKEKFGWRPMEGVRSVSEVFMHIAGSNYLLPQFAGFKSPAGLDRDLEKNVTEKSRVIEVLKQSFEFMRKAALATSDAELDKPAKMYGEQTTIRGVFFEAAVHMHEHLGQSIAYARMNGVVPPWTAAEQAPPPKK